MRTSSGLVDDLDRLASELETQDLRSAGLTPSRTSQTRDRLVRIIRAYLIPRLTNPDAPLCVVFAGPTGSGKSTLVNSLSGLEVSETGPIRPTTKNPVILASESARHHFENVGGVECEVVTGSAPILNHLGVVDTPDIDSTAIEHRVTAENLIDCADIVVMVTSALRYADLVPWEVLRRAMSRGTPLIFVLNRVTSSSSGAITDFASRLSEEGVEGDVIVVPEHHVEVGKHSVPALAVRELGRRLVGLTRDRVRYQREIFQRVVDSTITQISELAEQVERDREWAGVVDAGIRSAFHDKAHHLDMSGMVSGFETSEAPPGVRLRSRRWRRFNRLRSGDLVEFEATLRSRLITLVESDLRGIVLRDGVPGIIGGTVEDAVRGTHMITAQAIDGWLDMVRGEVDEINKRDRNLALAVLFSAALDSGDRRAIETLFGADGDVLIERLRLALLDRLQVVYTQTAGHLCESLAPVSYEGEADELTARLTRVVVRSHFADA
jgi:energy-coupling factor transporter ATP-binding protein EcfA2